MTQTTKRVLKRNGISKVVSFVVFVVSSVVGIGSLCFHATLLYEMQVRFCLTAKSSLINVRKYGGDDRPSACTSCKN